VEPTAGRFGCHRKNIDNKPRHVNICTQQQLVQHNDCKRLRIPPHSSHIISDEKRRVGGLPQQQHSNDINDIVCCQKCVLSLCQQCLIFFFTKHYAQYKLIGSD